MQQFMNSVLACILIQNNNPQDFINLNITTFTNSIAFTMHINIAKKAYPSRLCIKWQ